MRVLWICNVATPEMAECMGIKSTVSVSWLVRMSEEIRRRVDLYICVPTNQVGTIVYRKTNHVTYICVPRKDKGGTKFERQLTDEFLRVLKKIQPDCVHIHGTEFPHTYNAILAAEKFGIVNSTVVSIQGLVSIYARHYTLGLSSNICKKKSFRDFLKKDSIVNQQEKYIKRGNYEIESLKKVKNVIGRTDWDLACVTQINPQIRYYQNNETLREEFYGEQWSYENCEKHSIFMSQGGSPIKGMHLAIETLRILKKEYEDIKLYITGDDIIHPKSMRDILRQSYYARYLAQCIINSGLESNIIFLGTLDAAQMCQQYLNANVFFMPSTIENSPNSLGEAMLIGTPVVASAVGGVSSMLTHGSEGYMYQADAPYMAAFYIKKVFESNKEQLEYLSEQSRNRALITHNAKNNASALVEIYNNCAKENGVNQ